MLNCYIVDDESHAIKILESFISATPGLHLMGSTQNPLDTLEFTLKNPVDICFVDVEMPELSGIELAGLINQHTNVIFTTAFADFALEAFEKEAFDYLLKPIAYERFLKSIRRFETKKQALIKESKNDNFFYIKSEGKGKLTRVNISEIKYIEGSLNYVTIHFQNGTCNTYLTLNEILVFLPEGRFTRIHKSFIVNNERIRSIETNQVILDDKTCLTLGNTYRTKIFDDINKSILKTKRSI